MKIIQSYITFINKVIPFFKKKYVCRYWRRQVEVGGASLQAPRFCCCCFFFYQDFLSQTLTIHGPAEERVDYLLFHPTTSTRSQVFRDLFATFHVRWLSHVFLVITLMFTRPLIDEIYHLTELPFDWSIDWSIDWLNDWLTDWLIDWWMDGWMDGSIDWLIDRLIDLLIDWLIDWWCNIFLTNDWIQGFCYSKLIRENGGYELALTIILCITSEPTNHVC